jgi:hypothetical protein
MQHLPVELARQRTRSHLELAREVHLANRFRALSRARRTELKAERRLLQAWQARHDLEATLSR